jgi:pimeloyl-ACP methyl ester carboxylesterase
MKNGNVRIRYEGTGSGFPLLVTPGGGLNSRVSNWPTAVFNAMEVFKDDFRCITMDQRNANGGESTGPIAVDDPWGAFAEDRTLPAPNGVYARALGRHCRHDD